MKIFLLGTFIFAVGCSHLASHSEAGSASQILELPTIIIDETITDPFPAKPSRGNIYKTHNVITNDKSFTSDSSHSEGSESITIEQLADNKKKIEIAPDYFNITINNGKGTFKTDGGSIFKGGKLSILVDCSKPSVLKKEGFTEALDKIETKIDSKETQDAFIAYLSSFVEQATDHCKNVLGPFTNSQFIGKKPGSTWEEDVPVKLFAHSKLNAKFLGWTRREGQRFAVLEGRSNANPEGKSSSAKSSIALTTYLLISSDWKVIQRLALTSIDVNTKDKGYGSGAIKLDQISTELN